MGRQLTECAGGINVKMHGFPTEKIGECVKKAGK